MLLNSFPVGPLQCNCSIIVCPETKEAAIVDPGGDAEDIIKQAEDAGLKIKYLLHTHAHFDHVLGSAEVKKATGAKILLHSGDKFLYDNLAQQCKLFGFSAGETLPVDDWIEDDQEIVIGKIKLKVIHTPGHTPGSLSFSLADKESILFSGDTLFHRSIGRTDLWGGDYDQIIKSISDKLFTLDDSTRVIPGHGPDTDIWHEKKENPFLS
jgi:glyoxylase-like metal-dependent hydrolase (beta-lactamase superfamily II)